MAEEKRSVLITTVITGSYQRSRSSGYVEKIALDLYCEIDSYFLRVTEISLSGRVKHPDLQQIQCLEV